MLETSLKGSVAADLVAKAADGISVEPKDEAEEPDLDPDFPEAAEVVVGEGEGQQVQPVKLQLCE